MSRTVLILIATGLSAATFPAGTVSSGIFAALTANGVSVVPSVGAVENTDSATNADFPLVATFVNVPNGTYDLAVDAADAAGNALGVPLTATVVVADPVVVQPPTVAVTVPTSLSVVIQ
jgi:hypothetical protein